MLRSVIRDLSADEVSEAVDDALVAIRYVRGFSPNMIDVVRVTVTFGLTKGAANPLLAVEYGLDKKSVKNVILAVANWLRYDYKGVAESGLWERTRYLIEIAQGL